MPRVSKYKMITRGKYTFDIKETGSINGLQVKYTTDKYMKKNVKKLSFKTKKKIKISNIKSGRNYIMIRSYKIVKGKRYYSAWSDAIIVAAQ